MSIAEIVDRRRAARPTCLRRSRQRDAEQLRYFKQRTEDLQAKIAAYDMRANRRFYDIEPIAEENALLREQLAEARAEAAKYKGIAEPDASYFRNGGGYTLEHDLAIAECVTNARLAQPGVAVVHHLWEVLPNQAADARAARAAQEGRGQDDVR